LTTHTVVNVAIAADMTAAAGSSLPSMQAVDVRRNRRSRYGARNARHAASASASANSVGRPRNRPAIQYRAELVRYLQRDGRRKVLFGTNWPMIAPEQTLEHLDDLELEPEACRRFLGENARAVFAL
jgi:predicted TIM-barrel fold metal-dependent hydrolase